MSTGPRVTGVIVHHRAEELLEECLSATAARRRRTARCRRGRQRPRLGAGLLAGPLPLGALGIRATEWGFAAGTNARAALGGAEYLFILNPDARPVPGCLAQLVRVLEANPHVAAVGPQLISAEGEPRPSAGRAPNLQRLLSAKLARAIGHRPAASDDGRRHRGRLAKYPLSEVTSHKYAALQTKGKCGRWRAVCREPAPSRSSSPPRSARR